MIGPQALQLNDQDRMTLMALNRAVSGFATKVAAFMRAAGQEVAIEPKWDCNIPAETKELRAKLITEEVEELFGAMATNDFIGIADGIADVLYVVVGTALAYGIPVGLVFDVAHDNNMTKVNHLTGQVEKNEHGKVIKPEGFVPADFNEPLRVWDDTIKKFGGDEAFKTIVLDGYMRAYRDTQSRIKLSAGGATPADHETANIIHNS